MRTLGVPVLLLGAIVALPWGGAGAVAATQEEAEAFHREDPPLALREGRYEEAEEGFREWLIAEPGAVEAARGLAGTLSSRGRLDDALDVVRQSPAFAKSAELQAVAGRLFLRKGALQEAESALRKAVELDPRSPEALNRLGAALWKQGRQDEARRTWRALVRVYEEMSFDDAEALSAEGFVEIGLALMGLNRFKEAHDVMFAQAKEKDSTCPSALLESGRALLEKYNYPDSRFELRDALTQNPYYADALVLLADNLLEDFQKGTTRYDLVEKYVSRALDVNPFHSGAYVIRGAFWLSDGNVARGAEDFRRAVELDPSSLRARGYLAACYYLEGGEDAYGKEQADALAVNPKGAEFFHTIATAIEKKFRYQGSVDFCDRALSVDPEYWPAYATLAINCLRTRDEKRGREMLEKAWENDRYNVWVYNTRLLLKHMDANYQELRTDRFVFKFPKPDYTVLTTYLVPIMEDAYTRIADHYGVTLDPPIYVEAFSEHKWFSARTIGLEGLAAAGASFGNLVTLATARALPQNWGAVAWHEFAHVVTLASSRQRVPRWLTEGCSVFEEGRDHRRWTRVFEREIADAYGSRRLLPIAELDFGFSKPKYPNQILVSYFQGCLVVQFVNESWGFDAIRKFLRGYAENQSTPEIFRDVLGLSFEEFDRKFFEYVARWVASNGYQPAIASEVIPALELEIQAEPESASRLVDLAWAYHCSGVGPDVEVSVDKLWKIDPENADGHAVLGMEYLRRKSTEKAREHLEKALQGGSKFGFRVHAALANLVAEAGDKARAIELLERAKEISPRAGAAFPPRGNVYDRLAALYKEAGEAEKSIHQMEELSGFAPQDGACLKAIAEHYKDQEGPEAAKKTFDALQGLIFIDPYAKDTHTLLAPLAGRLGEHDVAIREYGLLLSYPDADKKAAYEGLLQAHAAQGDAARVREFAEKLREVDPENARAKEVLESPEGPAEDGAGDAS